MKTISTALAAILMLTAGCSSGGLSTTDIKRAAEQEARAKLSLGADASLKAVAFVGRNVDGKTVMCGTVQGKDSAGKPIVPQRFIAATDPLKWLVFESANDPSIPSRPNKFVEWTSVCAGSWV